MVVGRAMARKEEGTPVGALVSVGLLGGVFMGSFVIAGPHILALASRSGKDAYRAYFINLYMSLLTAYPAIPFLIVFFESRANQAPGASTNLAAKKKVAAVLMWVGLLGPVFMGSLVFAGPHIWALAFRSGDDAYRTSFFLLYFGLLIYYLVFAFLIVVFGFHPNHAPGASTNIAAKKKVAAVLMSVGLVGGLIIVIIAFVAPHIWASFQIVLSDIIRGYANPAPEAPANFTEFCILVFPVVAIFALTSHLFGKSIWNGSINVLIGSLIVAVVIPAVSRAVVIEVLGVVD